MSESNADLLPAEGLATTKQVVEFLNISGSMWSKLQKCGSIKPPTKIGSSSRWDVQYIRELGAKGIPKKPQVQPPRIRG